MGKPHVKLGNQITTNGPRRVVINAYEWESSFEAGVVVLDSKQPRTLESECNVEQWFFPDFPDFVGYIVVSTP